MVQYVNSPQKTLPSAADNVSVTSSSSSWVYGSWVTISASAPSAGVLTGITVKNSQTTNAFQFEVDIGVGGAGAETTIATIKGYAYQINNYGNMSYWPFHIGIDGWALGTRIATRIRTSRAQAITFQVGITYYESPVSGNLTTTSNVVKVLPSGSSINLGTGGSAWANGSYVTFANPLANDIALLGIVAGPSGQNGARAYEIDISTGAASSETVIHTVRAHMGSFVGFPWYIPFPIPLKVSGGARLALRARDDQNFPYNGQTFAAAIVYVDLPL